MTKYRGIEPSTEEERDRSIEHPKKAERGWDVVISARRSAFHIDLAALWTYRDLVLLLVYRDFVTFYKQTILGPLWYVLQPLLTTVVFTVVFSRIANIPTDGAPPFLFYFTGVVAWQYFSACMTKTSDTFVANAAMFGKIYFPRLVVPLAIVITNIASFLIQSAFLAAFIVYFKIKGAALEPNGLLLLLPLLVIQMGLLGLGVGALLSALTTRYRDLNFVVAFGAQLWMFATPIVYPMSSVPPNWQWVLALNPMAPIVETLRSAVLGIGSLRITYAVISVAITTLILLGGLILFSRVERTSMDTV